AFAAAEKLVDDLYDEYPELGPYDEVESRAFKKELVSLLKSPVGEQDAVLAGSPSEYKILPDKIKGIIKISKRILQNYDSPEKAKAEEGKFLLWFLIQKPVMDLEEMRKNSYAKYGLTDDEIDEMKEDNEDRAFERIYERKVSDAWKLKREEK
ncbi:hypothetical protein PFISCL1PPCAC_19028, partial [Pristionchus fissidentatus]